MNRRNRGHSASPQNQKKAFGRVSSKDLRKKALQWSAMKDPPLDCNQTCPSDLLSKTSSDMDWNGDGLSSAKKWTYNQSPLHTSASRDESCWLLTDSRINSSIHPSNSLFESSGLLASSSKAVLTISLPTTQIMMVNSVACKLLGYTAEELCASNLKDLIPDPQQWSSLVSETANNLQLTSNAFTTGAVVELTTNDGLRLPVFLFFKKIDSPERCVAVAETVDRRAVSLSVDDDEIISIFDDDVAMLFHYDSSELQGMKLGTLVPSVKLSTSTDGYKNRVTGRTKGGVCFPLCVVARRNVEDNGWHVVLWIYSNLSGAILIQNDLTIVNCNHLFSTLLFGYSKDSLIKESILKLLPGFCEDGEYGRERTMTADASDNDSLNEDEPENGCTDDDTPTSNKRTDKSTFTGNNSFQDCERLLDDLALDSGTEDDSSIALIKESDLDLQNEMTEKLASLNENGFRIERSIVRMRSSHSDDVLSKIKPNGPLQVPGASSHLDLKATGLREFPMNRASNLSNLSDVKDEEAVRRISEGTFSGRGRHRDGAEMDVVYRVREARGRNGYLVCIARDPWEPAEGGRRLPPNLTVTCSFNSTSLDSSYLKEFDSRPNSASIISQSDDVLTSGEYSEYYTNLQQIGKGAFGYVKMAYRNHDGLLVITKFIKKHKVHVRSWVLDPTLQMKVPLEVSLLTTLSHPNIVSILDVFHNENFFQLVMEKHGAGMDLFEFIDRKPKMDEKLASYIFRQMVSALVYLHSLGILHRDIKDENVIINEIFHVKLIDFGSAAFISPGRVFSTFYGTVEYCSPEVLEGNNYIGPELEMWALGVTLFVLIFGENPFYDVEETIKGEFAIPKPISSQLFSLIKGLLEKDVSARWDITRVAADPWVNTPVDPNNYSFQKVIKCDQYDACPAKFLSEYVKDELGRDEDDEDRTVASSNSFCSLHTIENLDESALQFNDSVAIGGNVGTHLTAPSVVLSSTPRRASATRAQPSLDQVDARKRYSLDLNTLKKLCESDGSKEAAVLHAPVICTKPSLDEFENYWDAEDEQYDNDSY